MAVFIVTLTLTAWFCALVAGFLFAYAIVIMPGLKTLDDREFIRAFQVTDNVIQRGQPLFMAVWLGSVLGVLISALLGLGRVHGADLVGLLLTALVYLVGVQLPTIFVNLPLNKTLQGVDTALLDDKAIADARAAFETPWNRANRLRTLVAVVSVLALLTLLQRA